MWLDISVFSTVFTLDQNLVHFGWYVIDFAYNMVYNIMVYNIMLYKWYIIYLAISPINCWTVLVFE